MNQKDKKNEIFLTVAAVIVALATIFLCPKLVIKVLTENAVAIQQGHYETPCEKTP